MKNNQFCHLHVHTEYSLLDGMGTCEQYARKAKEMGFEYLGCTDHGSVSGLIQFQRACDKEGIKPISGCELYIVPDVKGKDRPSHITVFVKDDEGWRNLLQMLTYANLEGFYRKPRVGFDFFLDHCVGLVILTGCVDSFLGLGDQGLDFLSRLEERMPDPWDLYFEVMPHDIQRQKDLNGTVLSLALETVAGTRKALPLAAANDCHYVEEGDWETQEVLLAIQRKAKWNDPNRWRFGIRGLHLRGADEMVQAFRDQGILKDDEISYAMVNTLDVARKCRDFRIKKQGIFLPQVRGIEKENVSELLYQLCTKGLERIGKKKDSIYEDRLNDEFDLVEGKRFLLYFLMVYDLVEWCRKNDIFVGPGRGSVGGSLMAYLLGIISVDPIEYGLLFSRFIAPDRIDFPDIDLDFPDDKRHLVKGYLERTYGQNNVSSIATFLRMKGRGALRDVARVFDVSLKEVGTFAKVIDDSGDARNNTRIQEAVDGIQEGRLFKKKYPQVVRHAVKLEGQVRGYGRHAAGVVVSGEDLTRGTKCNLVKANNEISINWEMYDAEHVGLMKLDILGLSTLTVLDECRRLIKENGRDIEFGKIPLDDLKVYEELSKGNTVGTFQFSGYACTELIKRTGVERFEDLAHVISLARPGPSESGMTDLFVERKKGKPWKKRHSVYEEITKETYGVLVYQEQVMDVIHKVAGLPYSTADKVRKVIGKKRDVKEFELYRVEFVEGCRKQRTFSEEEADEFWKGLLEWARYGFNKAHAVEYSLVGYWTAWLKFNFSQEFLCASLTYEPVSKRNALVKEAYRLGFEVMPPKVGISDSKRWLTKGNVLYAPFESIKGLGGKTALKAAIMTRTPHVERKGFFSVPREMRADEDRKTKLESLLEVVGAFDPQSVPEGIGEFFDFTISRDPRVLYPSLFKLFPDIRPGQIEEVVNGKVVLPGIFRKIRFLDRDLLDCDFCSLRKECTRPVMPSKGLWNIAIIGEGPGSEEDRLGKGFVGPAGKDVLWPELGKYGLERSKFHPTNVVKCFPSITKTPRKEHIEKCSPWLFEELERIGCRIALVFGNTGMMAFLGVEGGIMKKTGTTEWIDKHRLWACWCVHPAGVLHNSSNREGFERGIRNFVETIKSLGGGTDGILF